MEAKKLYFMEGGMNMNRVIDLVMTKLFQLAEYVCSRYSSTETLTVDFWGSARVENKRSCFYCRKYLRP